MRNRKRWMLRKCLLLCCLLLFLKPQLVRAEDGEFHSQEQEKETALQSQIENACLGEMDFREMEAFLKTIWPDQRIEFQQVVKAFLTGNTRELGSLFLGYFKDQIGYECRENQKQLRSILVLVILAAVFSNLSCVLPENQVSQIGFYIFYLLTLTLCMQSFAVVLGGIKGKLRCLIQFMRIFSPIYFFAVLLSSGGGTKQLLYSWTFFLIFLLEMLIMQWVLPMIQLYFLVQISNDMMEKEYLSELASLLKKVVHWSIKTILGIAIGGNLVQKMLIPAIGTAREGVVYKIVQAIPGIGNTFEGVKDLVFGSFLLVRNGIGLAGAGILLMLCLVPVLQLVLLMFLYQLLAAVLQPVAGKRMTGCIRSVGESYELLVQAFGTVVILFLITILIFAF